MKTLETILFTQGFGSRRQCRVLILNNYVQINGQVCNQPQRLLDEINLHFSVHGQTWLYHEKLLIALHKPAGYECSHRPQHHQSIFSLLPAHFIQRGIQAVGRLDQDTTGLLLLSDDGQLIHRYTSPKFHIPKTYITQTKHVFTPQQATQLLDGVILHGEKQPTQALTVTAISPYQLELSISEGKYHQVKRMLAAVGNRVLQLHRQKIGAFTLPTDLQPGQWQYLSSDDLKE